MDRKQKLPGDQRLDHLVKVQEACLQKRIKQNKVEKFKQFKKWYPLVICNFIYCFDKIRFSEYWQNAASF